MSARRRRRTHPRRWIEEAADRLNSDPGATVARLAAIADRLSRLEGPLPSGDHAELCRRLAALEQAVRLHEAMAAAVESTRPQIDALRAVLAAAGRIEH